MRCAGADAWGPRMRAPRPHHFGLSSGLLWTRAGSNAGGGRGEGGGHGSCAERVVVEFACPSSDTPCFVKILAASIPGGVVGVRQGRDLGDRNDAGLLAGRVVEEDLVAELQAQGEQHPGDWGDIRGGGVRGNAGTSNSVFQHKPPRVRGPHTFIPFIKLRACAFRTPALRV